jgi:hypothetical protein
MFGALGATIGVGALVFGIVESAERGWTNPMVLIGAGQGLAFAPLTTFGIAAVRGEDAGAASGLVNTAHQLGMALGLAALVAAAANATQVVSQVSLALTWGTGLLTLCLVVVLAVIFPAYHRSTHA